MNGYQNGKPWQRYIGRFVVMAIAVFAVSGFVHAKEISTASGATIEYSQNPSALIINYALHVGEIAGAEGGPSLQVFGDGLVQVFYPSYMTRSGLYELQLTDSEMTELLGSLVSDGILEFDYSSAVATVREIEKQREENEDVMYFVSDQSTSLIEMHLESYSTPGVMSVQATSVNKAIQWKGVRADARLYPEHVALQNLAAAERRLRGYMERQDLARIDSLKREAATAPWQD